MKVTGTKTTVCNISDENDYIYKTGNALPYATTKKITVEKNKFVGLEISPRMKWNSAIIMDELSVEEVINFCKDTPINSRKDKHGFYLITFIGEKNTEEKTVGVMKVSYKDYKGEPHSEYWKIVVEENKSSYESTGAEGGETTVTDAGNAPETTPESDIKPDQDPNDTKIRPTITLESTNKISDGRVELKITTKNATAVKYAITKRSKKADGTFNDYVGPELNYDNFSGAVVKNPKSFTIILDNKDYESGYYDITVMAKNQDNSASNYAAWGPQYINYETEIDITKTSVSGTLDKNYHIQITETGKDVIESYYYITNTPESGKYVQPSIEDVKNKGKKIQNNTADILFTTDRGLYKSGKYDLTVLSIDSLGRTTSKAITGIKVSNAPTVTYKITGEAGDSTQKYTATSIARKTQTVTFNVKDEDANDTLMVWYVITNEDLTKGGEVVPGLLDPAQSFTAFAGQNGYKIYGKKINSNAGEVQVKVSSEDAKYHNKYIYMCVQDNLGYFTKISTGKIEVDGTELKLETIDANKSLEKTLAEEPIGYKLGDTLELTFTFNHKMQEKAPNVKVKFGESEARVQDDITYNDNKITYKYELKDVNENGIMSIDSIDYTSGKFTDIYTQEGGNEENVDGNTYALQISEDESVKNLFKDRYYLDTQAPTIESAEIILTSGETTNVYDDIENNKKYVSNLADAQLKITFSEDVSGEKIPYAEFIKGKNATSRLVGSYTDKVVTYSIAAWMRACELTGSFDGTLELNRIVNEGNSFKDAVGNIVNTNIDNLEVKYKLDGEVTDKEILIDNGVTEAIVMAGDSSIKDDDIIGVGTPITCFAEYKNSNEQDCVGIKNVQLKIAANERNAIELKDKNNTKISDYVDEQDGTTRTYTLTEDQLPVSFSTSEEGIVSITTYKEDLLGNISEESYEINVSNYITISEENSRMSNLEEGTYYNYYGLTEDDKEYTLTLKLSEGITTDQITIKVTDRKGSEVTATHSKQITIENETYEQYTFNITETGKYNVMVTSKDTVESTLFKGEVSLKNVYKPVDANENGDIDIMDSVIILQYLAGKINAMENPIVARASDVNGDGLCKLNDVITLNKFIAEDVNYLLDDQGYIKISIL